MILYAEAKRIKRTDPVQKALVTIRSSRGLDGDARKNKKRPEELRFLVHNSHYISPTPSHSQSTAAAIPVSQHPFFLRRSDPEWVLDIVYDCNGQYDEPMSPESALLSCTSDTGKRVRDHSDEEVQEPKVQNDDAEYIE